MKNKNNEKRKRNTAKYSAYMIASMTLLMSFPITAQAIDINDVGNTLQNAANVLLFPALQGANPVSGEQGALLEEGIFVAPEEPADAVKAEEKGEGEIASERETLSYDFSAYQPLSTPRPVEQPLVPNAGAPAKGNTITNDRLEPGMQSKEVELLQKRLMQLFYFDADDANGHYGLTTEEAVRYFQRVNQLVISGVAEGETLELLFSANARAYTVFPGDKGRDVSSIQRRLHELEYYTGPINGYYDIEVVKAVKSFQGKNDIGVDGLVGGKTLEVLYSERDREASATRGSVSKRASGIGEAMTDVPMGESVKDFLSLAKSLKGKAYVWGDEGPNSFDCSGYVYYCLRNSGVKTSRLNAAGFSKNAKWKSVDLKQLEPGDLLFFTDDTETRIGHTGIYIGEGKMIHASSSQGMVVISKLSTPYWVRTIRSAKRAF